MPGDGRELLLVSAISGQLKAVNVLTGHIYKLDNGVSPSWYPDSKTIFYSQTKAIEGSKVISADIYHIQYDGSGKMLLTNDTREYETPARISPDGKNIAYVSLKNGAMYLAPLIKNAVRQTETGESPQFSLGSTVKISGESINLQKWNGVLPFTRQEIQTMPRQVEPSSQMGFPIFPAFLRK
ncbi:MAG: hypothetical protein LWW97_09935 [Deltaproteobacteria bacterium]|nr:hypothetical protein [Deltaproteobacteria bacterium]